MLSTNIGTPSTAPKHVEIQTIPNTRFAIAEIRIGTLIAPRFAAAEGIVAGAKQLTVGLTNPPRRFGTMVLPPQVPHRASLPAWMASASRGDPQCGQVYEIRARRVAATTGEGPVGDVAEAGRSGAVETAGTTSEAPH